MTITLYNADALEKLKELPNDSIDAIITDPPYQLDSIRKRFGKEGSAEAQYGTDGVFQRASKGFMGKEWDVLPNVDTLKECLRVLKPGAFALWMMTPRQDSYGIFLGRLAEAGFNVSFTSLYWVYASGFPKGENIAKAIAKREGALKDDVVKQGAATNNTYTRGKFNPEYQEYKLTENAKKFDGSYAGFQPKPAIEVIIVSMKPLNEKTYVEQALKNRHGITWLDDCRIPYGQETPNLGGRPNFGRGEGYGFKPLGEDAMANSKGRFPANIIVSDNAIDTGINRKVGYMNPNLHKRVKTNVNGYQGNDYGKWNNADVPLGETYGDSGDLSRFFSLDAWWEQKVKELPKEQQRIFPLLYAPKASKSERNQGLENMPGSIAKNIHPTVKPVAILSYLIILTSREGDTILDPFIGSGTTAVASYMLRRNCIGIEREKEYYDIAQARISYYEKQAKL